MVDLATIALTVAAATVPAEPWSAWEHEQSVRVDRAGLAGLTLEHDLLDVTATDLGDLRLIDADGREVPYAVRRRGGRPARVVDAASVVRAVGATTLVTIRSETTEPIAAVRIQTPANGWIKTLAIEGRPHRGAWRPIVDGVRLFRLRDGADELEARLVAADDDARPWRELRLTLDDRRSDPIPITGARLVIARIDPPSGRAEVATIVGREETADASRLTLRLPARNLRLAAISIESAAALFDREVRLFARRLTDGEIREEPLAAGRLFRDRLGDERCERLRLTVERSIGERDLVLVVGRADDRPLPIDDVTLHLLPTELLFHLDFPGELRLLTGNPAARSPRYDIAGLIDRHDEATAIAVVGLLLARPSFARDDGPSEVPLIAGPMPETGWRWRKPIRIREPGIQELELDLEVLSRATTDGRDLRVVDGGAQVPYVVDRSPRSRIFEVQPQPVAAAVERTSRWRLQLPRPGLPIARLSCDVADDLLRRDVVLFERPRDRRGTTRRVPLTRTTWIRRLDEAHLPLRIILAGRRAVTDTLFLELQDGDNPPLALTSCELAVPTSRLLFRATSGTDLELHYGNAEVVAPRYDVGLIEDRLFRSRTRRATLGAEREREPRRWWQGSAAQAGPLLWVALSGAVIVFLVVVARLLPSPPRPTDG